jgi:hypothetical protein
LLSLLSMLLSAWLLPPSELAWFCACWDAV